MNVDWSMLISAAVIAGVLPVSILSLTVMLARHERLSPHAESDDQIRRRFTDAEDLRDYQRRVDAQRQRSRDEAVERYVQVFEGQFAHLDPREVPRYRDAINRTLAAIEYRSPSGSAEESVGGGGGHPPLHTPDSAALLSKLMGDRSDGSRCS